MSLKSIKPATIRKVVNYLQNELNLSVYGSYIDLDHAQGNYGCMDYNADDIIKLRSLYMRNIKILLPDENES